MVFIYVLFISKFIIDITHDGMLSV